MHEPLNEDTVYIDHLSASNQPSNRICESKIIPNIFSDHSAVVFSIPCSEHEPLVGPASAGEFSNSFLSMFKSSKRLDAWLDYKWGAEREHDTILSGTKFLQLRKTNHRKTYNVLENQWSRKINRPWRHPWRETERFFKSKNRNPNGSEFIKFFNTENVLSGRNCKKLAKRVMSIDECKWTLMRVESNKTAWTDGLTSEFYRYFWNALSKNKTPSVACW